MNKILSILLTFVMLMYLSACSQSTPAENDSEVDLISIAEEAIEVGDYKQAYSLLLKSESKEAADLLQNFIFMPISFERDGSKTTYTYDSFGNLLTDEVVYKSGSWEKIAYTYDDSGKMLSYTATTSDGEFCNVSYAYDKYGKLITVQHDGTYLVEKYEDAYGYNYGTVWERISYTYDDAGNMLTEKYTYPDGTYDMSSFSYDNNGNMLTKEIEITSDKDFSSHYTVTHVYDNQGKMQGVYDDGSGSNITYTYDESGNLTLTEENSSYHKTITTYNEYGSVLTEEHFDEDGQMWYTYSYSYDESNNILSRDKNYSDGKWSKYVYTYDDCGNMTEMTATGVEGSEKEKYTGKKLYSYDEYGNWLTCEYEKSHSDGVDERKAMSWELYYFSNGVTGRAKEVLEMYKAFPFTIY